MPQIKDFPESFTPGQYVTLTWNGTNFDGSSRLPVGVTIVTSNAKGALGLTLASRLGKDPSPQNNLSSAPQILSGALSVSAQIGPGVAGESYLLTLALPLSNGDLLLQVNHINCVQPS